MKVSSTVYPTNPLTPNGWYNYLSLMVDKRLGVNRVVKRQKVSQSKNKIVK